MKKSAHPVRNIIVGVFVLLATAALVAAVWYGTRVDMLTITDVVVEGGETIEPAVVAASVERQLVGEYLKFIPRRFAWTYPKGDIVSAIDEIERVHNIAITRRGKTLYVTFDEYVPQALWCESRSNDKCVFLTNDGYGFAPAPVLSGGTFVRYVTLNRELVPESQAIEVADFQQLTKITELLATQGWYVASVELDRERDAFIHLVNGGELKITLRQTPQQTVDNLRVVLGSEDFAHLVPGAFTYIDLRFGEKVFVNEFGAPTEQVATSTASSTEQ